MKLFKSPLVLLFCGALLVSCVPADELINPLTGTWTVKGISCQNCIDKTQIVSTTYSCDESGCNTYTFNRDGSIELIEILSGSAKATNGTYSISGTTVSLNFNDGSSPAKTYSYTLSGSMLYLKEIVDNGTGKCGSTTVLAK